MTSKIHVAGKINVLILDRGSHLINAVAPVADNDTCTYLHCGSIEKYL